MTYRNLTETTVRRIADRYGLDHDSKIVRENAEQADRYHGTVASNFDGDMDRFWGCDRSGRYDARRLLEGYLAEESRVMEADARSHAAFCRNAY